MDKNLARTLTTALVQFIDSERPEGSMCCSNTECERLEKAFEANNLDFVEGFMEKKLSRLTEFEQEVSDIVEYCKEHGENVAFDYAKRHAKTLLALAKEECKNQIESDYRGIIYSAYKEGREDALKDLPKWRRWENGACGNSDNNPIAIVKRGYSYKLVTTLGIQGEHYIMLSDLEKLPGFKKDEE